ncbi:hypothetical protein P691DRAFT_728077 [Macrolepiota fuliginosa MF-IS2]|uniref:Uncharacterized protein n=1 Tax=Macrolepiota fuliginosa MF-IS2 TaxID=1400762 RepID=A0A9P5XHK2_9AGAR|nr:hypothetical protein P691DRAFT_728077 [Macrolepiota fuliginosa MF-IS2]
MIIDPPPDSKRGQNPSASTAHDDDSPTSELHLSPGAPHRKPRSIGKLCLWITLGIGLVFGGMAAFSFVRNFWYRMRHPHREVYHNTPEDGVLDWSQVVRPIVTKESKFDIIASVWVRDDSGKDGVVIIDGEERAESLVYTGKVFQGVDFKSNNVFANVTLRVPTSHFKQANVSNYDLRASFVLVQPDQPSWLEFATNYTTWRPQGFNPPSVRQWKREPTLEDQIYDSFGITIPLIQFHNITSRRSAQPHVKEPSNRTIREIEPPLNEDEDKGSDWDDDDDDPTNSRSGESLEREYKSNTFNLEFIPDQKLEYHPYIVTRTHLRVVEQTKLFKRQLYNKAQKELAAKICVDPKSRIPYGRPQWYQCIRVYKKNGEFETKVQLRIPQDGSDNTGKGQRAKWRTEGAYAPFLSAMLRAPGPQDLLPVPVAVEGTVPQTLVPDEEYISVTWKLAFSGRTPEKLAMMDMISAGLPGVYNMTAPKNDIQIMQHMHDSVVGIFGHRIHEDTHPRRSQLLLFTSAITRIICWFLTIHYWYTRTSTVGIARIGTTFLASSLLTSTIHMMAGTFIASRGDGSWFTKVQPILAIQFIPPFVMLKAVSRLEFGWSSRKGKSSWIPRVFIAKATHLERASQRVEGRVSWRAKLALLVLFFVFVHFIDPLAVFVLTPRIPPPEKRPHPLHSLSPHAQTILEHVFSIEAALYLAGSILQFIMNAYSRTYAGKYKLATILQLFAFLLPLLNLVPHVVGRNFTSPSGLSLAEGVRIVILCVDMAQAVKFRNVNSSTGEDAE